MPGCCRSTGDDPRRAPLRAGGGRWRAAADDGARLRERLAELARTDLGPRINASLASLRGVKEALILRAERLVRAGVAGSTISPSAVRSFERASDDLQERRAAVTEQLSAAADQRRDEAARDAGRARTRVAVSAAAIAGLLLLALMLDRVGGILAAVVAELRAGAHRQRFASELAEALDGVDSEAEAFGVIERAMGHAAGQRPMELLLADSSEARSSGWRSAGRAAPPAARWTPRGAAWPSAGAPRSPSRPARR